MAAQVNFGKATEQEWIEALKRKDTRACRCLVQEYLPSLYAFFQGMGCSATEAEDLAQETFAELWRSFELYRGDASLKTWVFLLGRRVAWKQFRRSKTHLEIDEFSISQEDREEPRVAAKQEEWLWLQQRDESLRQCVDKLAASYREILLLHYMEELSIQEVAQILEISTGTVKSRLNRALTLLRTEVHQLYDQT